MGIMTSLELVSNICVSLFLSFERTLASSLHTVTDVKAGWACSSRLNFLHISGFPFR